MIINVNKPKGMTSRDVVNICNRIFETGKVGHTGTLDPIASGVLIICTERDTKLVDLLTCEDKEYIATIKIGIKTDTGDITGTVIKENPYIPSREEIIKNLNNFLGITEQTVPIYSAVKINGKKLYEYARNNEPVELPVRKINVNNIELLEYIEDEVTFKATVSKGTYIRSLIEDICEKMGTVGTMKKLTRTKQGNFKIEDSATIEDLQKRVFNEISRYQVLEKYQKEELTIEKYNQVLNGSLLNKDFKEKYIIYTFQDEIIAIYEEYSKDEKLAKPYIMFKVK